MELRREADGIHMMDGEGREMGYVLLRPAGGDRVEIVSTVVQQQMRGQGLAAQLLEAAAAELRSQGQRAVPVCSYAAAWFARHPEQGDLLARQED